MYAPTANGAAEARPERTTAKITTDGSVHRLVGEIAVDDSWVGRRPGVLISHDAAEAVRLAAQTGGTAVLCNPMGLAGTRTHARS